MAEYDEHDERDEREYYDPLLDDTDLKSIVEGDDDEKTLRSQEELLGVTRRDSTNETQVTLVVQERPGNPGEVQEDGHSCQELPMTSRNGWLAELILWAARQRQHWCALSCMEDSASWV